MRMIWQHTGESWKTSLRSLASLVISPYRPSATDNNNSLCNSRRKRHLPLPHKPAQNVLAENLSKLCKLGQRARSRGRKITCPGHDGCTATMKPSDHCGDEKKGGRKLAKILLEGSNPVTVDKITTDADGRMGDEGFSTKMKEKQNISTKLFLDTVHLNRAVAAAISRSGIKPKWWHLQK